MPGRSDNRPIRTGPPCRSIGLNRPAVPRHDVGHVRHVVGRHRYGRVESVGRPCDRDPIGHLTDELARVGQRPVAHGGQEDAPIGCGRADGIPGIVGDVSIQCGVEKARVAEEPEHGPATRLRGEVGGKPRHRGVGAVAGRRHDLASRCIACKHDVQVIAEQCLGDEHRPRLGRSRKPRTGNRRRGAPAPPRRTRQSRQGARTCLAGRGGRPPGRRRLGTRIPCDLKHAASAAHRTEAATAQHRAVLPTQVATSNPAIARLRKTAKRSSAVRTFLNSSRPGYVATRMIGTSPAGVARRRLGGCCKRQHQDCPRRLLQLHHRSGAATERERHGEECRVARIAPARHGRPSGLKRAKRRIPRRRACRPR